MTKKKEQESQLTYQPPQYSAEDNGVHLNRNALGLGLGNINTGYAPMPMQADPSMQQQPTQQQRQAVIPMLSDGQQYGANVYANTNPNLNYVKYGGTVAAGLGDMTLAYEKSHDAAQGYRGDTNTTTVQYTPSQLAGLIAEAKYTQNQNNYGYDGTNISGGVAYSQGPWNASVTGNKRYGNQGNEDKNISANIGYRW